MPDFLLIKTNLFPLQSFVLQVLLLDVLNDTFPFIHSDYQIDQFVEGFPPKLVANLNDTVEQNFLRKSTLELYQVP